MGVALEAHYAERWVALVAASKIFGLRRIVEEIVVALDCRLLCEDQ